MMVTDEDVRLQIGDGQADAVDRDRALVDQIRIELRRNSDPQPPVVVAECFEREELAGPSTWPCTMWPLRRPDGESGRSRLTRDPARRSPRLLRRSVSGARSAENESVPRSRPR